MPSIDSWIFTSDDHGFIFRSHGTKTYSAFFRQWSSREGSWLSQVPKHAHLLPGASRSQLMACYSLKLPACNVCLHNFLLQLHTHTHTVEVKQFPPATHLMDCLNENYASYLKIILISVLVYPHTYKKKKKNTPSPGEETFYITGGCGDQSTTITPLTVSINLWK